MSSAAELAAGLRALAEDQWKGEPGAVFAAARTLLTDAAAALESPPAGQCPDIVEAVSDKKLRVSPADPSPEPPSLFFADNTTVTFARTEGGKIRMTRNGWDDAKVMEPGQVFEVRGGRQGIEGRILSGPRAKTDAELLAEAGYGDAL